MINDMNSFLRELEGKVSDVVHSNHGSKFAISFQQDSVTGDILLKVLDEDADLNGNQPPQGVVDCAMDAVGRYAMNIDKNALSLAFDLHEETKPILGSEYKSNLGAGN